MRNKTFSTLVTETIKNSYMNNNNYNSFKQQYITTLFHSNPQHNSNRTNNKMTTSPKRGRDWAPANLSIQLTKIFHRMVKNTLLFLKQGHG